MCFSANASFTAGAVLLTTGFVTLRKVKTPDQILFASIPILFGLQQLTEGFLWTSFMDSGHANWTKPTMYIFLVFAQVIWPSWVPLSVLAMEKEKKPRRFLTVILFIGISLSAYLAYCLLTFPVEAKINAHHIKYVLLFPHSLLYVCNTFYFITTVVAPFISSVKKMPLVGVATLTSFLFSAIFFPNYVLSVWCFFAAIISIVVYLVIARTTAEIPQRHRFSSQ